MAWVLSLTMLELIPMLSARRPTCSVGALSAARWLETPSVPMQDFFPGRRLKKRGHRGDFATPMDHSPKGSSYSRGPCLRPCGLSRGAHSRRSREVGQAGRAGIRGIIWRVLSAYLYLERRREPSRQLARPMEFSRTRITSRPTRALETSEKCARFNENERRAIEDPRQGKGVKGRL